MAQRQLQTKKIKSISRVGVKPVYDITVANKSEYVFENGVITHNTGSYYSADNIYIIGRQQEKTGTEITGYNFIINVEKSRHVREKSKIPVEVSFTGGISRWSGLLDIALESGHVIKPSNGWYSRVNGETGEIEDKKWRQKDTDSKEFWMEVLQDKTFTDWIKNRYQVAHGNMLTETDDVSEVLEAIDDEGEE